MTGVVVRCAGQLGDEFGEGVGEAGVLGPEPVDSGLLRGSAEIR